MPLTARQRIRLLLTVDKQRYFYSRIVRGLTKKNIRVEGPHPIDGLYEVTVDDWTIARVKLSPIRITKLIEPEGVR